MTDVKVPISAPGATQAASEVRDVAAAAREAVAAGERLRILVEQEGIAYAKLTGHMRHATAAKRHLTEQMRAENRARAETFRAMERESFSGRTAGGGSGGGGGSRGFGPGGMPTRATMGSVGRVVGQSGLMGRFSAAASLGPLGVAAGLAAAGLFTLAKFSEKDVEAAKALFDARMALADKLKDAEGKATDAGVSQFQKERQARARLVGAGVKDADAQAAALNAKGFTGSMQALGELQSIKDPEKRSKAMAAAQKVAQMEGIGLDDATKAVAGQMRKRGGASELSLAGATAGAMRGGRALTPEQVDQELLRHETSKGGRGLSQVSSAEGFLEQAKRTAGNPGAVSGSLRTEAGAINDPSSAVRIKEEHERQRHVAGLEAMADAEWGVVQVMKDMARQFSFGYADGSFQQQARRLGGGR